MSTTAQTSSRVALQPISSSALNARLFTASFSSNLKAIIDRTPQLKRSLTVDVGSLQSSKKFCNRERELVLPSPLSTPKLGKSFPSRKHPQASMLKARLQMAYYKIKHQQTQVPSKQLLDSFTEESSKSSHPKTGSSFVNHETGTPKKKKSTDLLASSTPIPISIFKNSGTLKKASFKSVSFKATLLKEATVTELINLRHPFLPQLNYTSSSPSKFVTSLPAAPSIPNDTNHQPPSRCGTSLGPKRTLKAPTISVTKAVKLPSLYEVTSNMNTSTPLPNKNSKDMKLSNDNNLTAKDNLFTPVKPKNKKRLNTDSIHDDSTQLMSSPSNLTTTPSSMGAAKSLLQLAFDKK